MKWFLPFLLLAAAPALAQEPPHAYSFTGAWTPASCDSIVASGLPVSMCGAPDVTDLDRALAICRDHAGLTIYKAGPDPKDAIIAKSYDAASFSPGWGEPCMAVQAKADALAAERVAAVRKTEVDKEAADLEFVKKIAGEAR